MIARILLTVPARVGFHGETQFDFDHEVTIIEERVPTVIAIAGVDVRPSSVEFEQGGPRSRTDAFGLPIDRRASDVGHQRVTVKGRITAKEAVTIQTWLADRADYQIISK